MSDPTFTRCLRNAGREIVWRRGRMVGDIVPNAIGNGGTATMFDCEAGYMPETRMVRTRDDAHAIFAIEPRVPGQGSASSGNRAPRVSRAPANQPVNPHNARNPQGAK